MPNTRLTLKSCKTSFVHKPILNPLGSCAEHVALCELIEKYSSTNIAVAPEYGLTSLPVWISNHMPSKVLDEITYPFPNFNGATVEGWEWISNFIPHSMLGLKWNHVSKRGPGCEQTKLCEISVYEGFGRIIKIVTGPVDLPPAEFHALWSTPVSSVSPPGANAWMSCRAWRKNKQTGIFLIFLESNQLCLTGISTQSSCQMIHLLVKRMFIERNFAFDKMIHRDTVLTLICRSYYFSTDSME